MAIQRPRDLVKLACCVLAVSLGFVANYLFTGSFLSRAANIDAQWQPRHFWAIGALMGAIAAAWFALAREDDFEASPTTTPPMGAKALRLINFLPALLLYLGATILYLADGETSLVRWLWIAGIVAVFVPLVSRLSVSPHQTLRFWEFSILLVITCVAFATRYTDLTQLPYHVDNDVSIMGLYSRQLVLQGDFRWVGMAPTEHPFSEHQFQALSMRLFGRNHFGLVMLSVLAGTATVPVLYFLGRMCFNRWVGLIAAVLLSFDYVHIHFSRLVFGPVATFFISLAGMCIVYGIRKMNAVGFAAGGACTGLAMLCYYSGRVAPVLYAAVFIWWLIHRKTQLRIPGSYWMLALFSLLAVFGPNLVFSLSEWTGMNGRGNTVILWTEPAWQYALYQYGADASVARILGEQTLRTFLSPFFFPDTSTIFYIRKPMLGVLAGVGLLGGIAYCFRWYRNPLCALPIFWVGLTFVLGGVLTSNPPFWPHLNIAVPALVLLSAVGLERLTRLISDALPRRLELLVPGCLLVALALSALQNWSVYYAFAARHAGGDVHATRQVQRLSGDYRVYLVSGNLHWTQETFAFLTPHVEGRQLSAGDVDKHLDTPTKPTAYLVYEDIDKSVLNRLTAAFPNAVRQVYYDGWGYPVFTMIRVFPPGYVESPQLLARPAHAWWTAPGGKYLVLGAILVLGFGGLLLHHELRWLDRRI